MLRWLSAAIIICIALAIAPAEARKQRSTRQQPDTGAHSIIRAQVLLDRLRFSPGPIDGRDGANLVKAVKSWQRGIGLPETGRLGGREWELLAQQEDRPILIDYEITADDVEGPFTRKIPDRLEDMAGLERLSYTGPEELLGEKFHIDTALMARLNPGKQLDRAGTVISVPDVQRPPARKAKRIEVDKHQGVVRAYDAEDALIATYPATIGSSETPSPEGSLKVVKATKNPTYVYDPKKLDFKGVRARKKFEIAPGPNNPVGLVWIGLNKQGYGIHGSPEPKAISRQRSHGCVRLTNWDALDLAAMVAPGVPVEFLNGQEGRENAASRERRDGNRSRRTAARK